MFNSKNGSKNESQTLNQRKEKMFGIFRSQSGSVLFISIDIQSNFSGEKRTRNGRYVTNRGFACTPRPPSQPVAASSGRIAGLPPRWVAPARRIECALSSLRTTGLQSSPVARAWILAARRSALASALAGELTRPLLHAGHGLLAPPLAAAVHDIAAPYLNAHGRRELSQCRPPV